ncbi:Coiled-coil domain-containing protein 168, partial [Galemys pyrenaicus]
DQVRLLEENVRHQIPLKPKAPSDSSKGKDIYLYSSSQESLIQNHHSAQMNISAQTQDSSPGQNVIQNQSVYDAQLTSQPQLVHNQEVIYGQHDRQVRSFALPQNLQRKPLSSSTQDSSQAQVVARSQPLVKEACSLETQDSIKIIESDKHLNEAQCSKSLKDSDKKEDLLQRQNTSLKNARHLVLTLIPNAVAEGTPQLQSIKRKIQEQIASSESSQYSVPDPVPVLPERQKKHRKILHSKSKCSVKGPSEQPKKAVSSQAHQTTVCSTSEHSKLGCNYNIRKKKELYQRKETSYKALPLTYVSKPVAPYIKKYSRKNLLEVVPGLQVCTYFLLKRDKSLGAEVNYAGSIEKRETSGDTKNRKQQSKDNKGLKTIPPKISPQLEQSFVVNTFQLKASCSSSVETNWNNKESLKGPVTQVTGISIAEFLKALKGKGTCDLCMTKHPTPLAETASEPTQGFVSPSNLKSNRRLKTQEDRRSPEKPHPPLSDTEKVPTSPPERSFPKRNTQCKTLKIVLESPDANLLISLETKVHDSSEQSVGTDIKESTGNVIWKKEKPLQFHIMGYGDSDESEELEYNRAYMGAQGVSGAPHRTAHTATCGPPDRKMPSRLKSKTETSRIVDFSHSVVRQEELSDEKISTAKYIEKKRVSKKPQGHDKEEEEQVLQEAALAQTEDFRLSLELTLQGKYVKFEIEQSNSGNKKTQNKEQTAQPQTVSTQTTWETNPCPIAGLFQVEKVKLSADRPTGRESTDPEIPLPEPEKLPVGESSMETFESCVPCNEDPKKIPGHTAEEKQHLKRVFPSVALGSFISHMLHSSYLKRQNIRKTWPGTQSVFRPQRVVMKAKKSAILLKSFGNRCGIASHRKRSRDNLKVIIKKQKPQDETVPDVLPNVIYPHKPVFPRTRMQESNTENHSPTKLKLEKLQVEKEEQCSGFLMKGGDARNRPEAKLQNEVRGNETAPPKTALPDPWDPQSDGYPETDLQSEEEMHRPVPARAAAVEAADSPITEPAHREQHHLMTQGDLRWATDSETTLSPAESLTGDTLKQTRESDCPGYENDTRGMGHFFVEKDLPEHLPATSAETSGCHASTASHSKVKKNRVRFSHVECSVEPKSAHMKTVTPSMPHVFNIQGRREKLESYFQTKCEKIIQANGMVYEFLNTLYSPGPGRLQRDGFGHPQLIGGEPVVHERRPQYVDFFANMKNAFSDREEKVQDGKEEEQNTVPEAAAQHTRYRQPRVGQEMETPVDKQDPTLDFVTWGPPVAEQDTQHQTHFAETALHTDLRLGPGEAEGIQKTNTTGSDPTAPPQSGTASFRRCLNTTPECGLPFSGKLEEEGDSYVVETNSELLEDLQVASLQFPDPFETCVPESKRKKNTLKLARQHMTMSCRCRTRRRERLSISHVQDGRKSQRQQKRRKTKHPEQTRNFAAVFWDVIHSKVPILINTKMSSGLNGGREWQKITRLDHIQVMRVKSPSGREVCCPDYAEMMRFSSSVTEGKEVAGEHAGLPAPEASPDLLFDTCQRKDQGPMEPNEEQKQPGSINVQVRPQTQLTPAVLGSASFPLFYQFQLGEPEGLVRFSPPKSREAKTDGIIVSAGECGIPSAASHGKEQRPGGTGEKERVTFNFYEPASATPTRKRNFEKDSDMRMSVSSACGIRKANKPPVSCILSVKGGGSPHRGEEPGHDFSPNVEEMEPGKEVAARVSMFVCSAQDSGTYSKIGREKDMRGEKRLCSQQVKRAITPHGGIVSAGETKEVILPDQKEEESELETFLKNIPQHSQHFIFCSGPMEEFDPHESEGQEPDAPQHLQPVRLVQGELPDPRHQTQADTLWTARSQLHLLQAKEAHVGQVLLATVKYGLAGHGSCVEELYRDGQEDKAEAHKDRQDTVLESSDGPTSSLPESDRQRETFTRRALSRMSSRCVAMKARKAPASQILNISGSGRPRLLPAKTLKSHISGFLVHRKFSGAPEDRTIEQRGRAAPERPATVLESWDLPTLTFPASKRKRNNLQLTVKRSKMSLTRVTSKVKKALTFLTFKVTRHGTWRRRRQFEHNLKIMMQQGQPVADIILNVISSLVPVAPDVKVPHGTGVETDSPWETRVGAELLLQVHPTGRARAEAGGERARTSTRHHGREARWEGAPLFPSDAHRVKEAGSVTSDLELKSSVKGHTPGSPAAARGPQRPALFAQSVVCSVSRCESVADTLSSPTLAASGNKIEMETHSTLNLDEPEGTPHSRAPPELEGPAHAWGARKACSTDVRNRPTNTTQRKEQREREEDDFPSMSPASAACANQHSSVRSLYMRHLGPCKSGLEQNSLEGRETWNLPSVVQKKQQEKHIREMVLEPISRHVMDVLQVRTVKERPHTQEGKEGGAQLETPLPKAGKSEAGLIRGRSPQDGDPRGRRGGPITEEKAWNQNDLLRTVLRALDFSSLESSALRSQDCTLGRAGKRGLGPKHGPGRAKTPAVSQLRHTARAPPGNHRRQQQHTPNKRKERQRQRSVGELLLCAPRGAWVLPPTSALDQLLFALVAKDTLCNRTHHADLGGRTTEEKTEGEENSAGTFLGPLDFLMPILSDSKGQQDTAQLSGEKIILTVKNKESPTSPVFKTEQHFITKCRGERGSNLKTKVKEMKPSRDMPEAVSFTWGPADAPRQGRLVGEPAGMARACHVQAAQPELLAAGLSSHWRAAPAHAAFCIPKEREQRTDRAPESRAFTADLKSAHTSVSLSPHTETGPSPGAWALGEDASQKEHARNKAGVRQEEECGQQASSGTSQKTPPSELGTAQGRVPVPFRSEAPLMGPQGLRDLMPQETERDLKGQEARMGVRGEFCPELSPYPKTHLPLSGEQKKESEGARGRKEHPRGSPETLPVPAAHCPRDEVQIKPPWGRARESPMDRASDTPGKVGRAGLTDQMAPRSAGRRARELFQRKTARKTKALQEAVSTVDYTPIAREIGSLIIENLGKATHGALPQPVSSSKPCLPHRDSPAHRAPAEGAHGVPEERGALTEANAGRGHSQKRGKRQDFANPRAGQQRLLVPCGDLLEHRPRPHSDSWVLPHLVALAKRVLAEVSRTAAPRLLGSRGPDTACVCRPERAASVTSPAQMQVQSAMLPLEPSFPHGRTSPEEAQVTEATPRGSSPAERERGRVQSHGGQQRALPKARPPGVFVHSLAIYLPALSGSKRQKVRVDQGLEKAMWCPQRRCPGAKKSGFSQALHTAGYSPWSSRPGPRWRVKEKLVRRGHGRGNPDLAVASTCAFIAPPPHARRNPETASGQISNGERTKQRMLQEKQDGIKGVKLSLPLLPNRKDSPALLHIMKRESEAEEGEGESDVEVASVRPCLPSLPRPHLHARAYDGEGKQRAARSCLPPHGLQASSNIGKISLAESTNTESVITVVEPKQHSPLRRKQDRETLVRVNDMTGLRCITFKGRRTHFQHILLGNKPQQNRKEQEQMRQKDKTGPAVVQKDAQAATPHLPNLEWGAGIRPKVPTRTVARSWLPTLTRWGLATTVGMCEEPDDDVLSSIKKAKYMSRKGEGGMARTLEEIRCPRRAARMATQPAYAQGFPWPRPRKEGERKTPREECKHLRTQSKSCPSVAFLPYSEVVRGRKVKRTETKSCFLQPQTQKPSKKQKTACKGPLYADASNSAEKARERTIQEQEGIKTADALPLEKKKAAGSQETQLDSKEQEEKLERLTGQPSVVLTGTCTLAPSHSILDPRIKKAGFVIEITKYSLPKQSHRKRNAVKKANEDPSEGGISSDVQEAQEHVPQKEEVNAQLSARKDLMHPDDKDAQDKAALPTDAPSSVKEQDRRCPGSAAQGRPDGTERTEDVTQKREDEANILQKDAGQPGSTAVMAKLSTLSHLLETETLQVSVMEHRPGALAGGRVRAVTLSKTGPSLPSSTPLKWSATDGEAGEPGTSSSTAQLELQQPLPSGQPAPAEPAGGSIKRAEPRPEEEKHRARAAPGTGVVHPRGAGCKAETSQPPRASSVSQPCAPSWSEEAEWDAGEKAEQEAGRAGDPKATPTETPPPPAPRSPRRRWTVAMRHPERDSRSSRGKGKPGAVLADVLASFPSPSDLTRDVGRKEREDILGLTKPYFPPLRIQDPYSSGRRAHAKSSDRNVRRGEERRRAAGVHGLPPRHVDLQAKKFSPSHVLSTETLRWEIEARESKLQEGKALVIGLKSICASLLTLPYFQCDVAEERATLRIAKSPRSQLPCKELPGKAAHPPTAAAELSSDLEELEKCTLQEEEDSEEDTDLSREAGPGHVDLETNKSPVSLTWRRSGPLWKRKGHEGKAPAGEPGGVTPVRTCASRAALLHRPGGAGVEQGGLPRFARPSFPLASFPASPEPREISAPPHNARAPPPRGRPGEGAGPLRPRCQGKELQEGEGEPGVVPNTPSGSRSSLQVDRGAQADNELPALGRSSRQRASKAGGVVPTEHAGAGALKAVQNEEPREPQKGERGRERAADQSGVTPSTHITLKSTASPRSAALHLHRTELHLRVLGRAQQQHQQRQGQGQGHAPSRAPRQACVSKAPPASPTLDKGTQVDERRLGVQRPPPLPPPPAALPDAEESAGSEARGGGPRRGKERWSQNRCALQTVDVNLRVRPGEARVSPLSRMLEAQGLVLNVKTLTGARRIGDQEPRIFLTRAFLCTPAAGPLELESGRTAGSTAPRVTGPAGPQGALRESPDAQRAAPGEVADRHREVAVKRGASSCRAGVAPQQWTSDFLICLQGRKEPPPAKSKGGLHQMVLNSQDEDVYFTGFGTISSGKRLECLFMGQKAQSEKYGTEALSPFLSCPTKRENREEENSDDRADAEGTPKETHRVPKAPSPPAPIAPPQETLPEAAPRSAHSDSSPEMPEEDGRRHHRVSQAASATGPAAQTWGSQEEVKGAASSGSPKRKGPNMLTQEVVLPSEGGPQPGQNARVPVLGPLPNQEQQTPPGVDVCKAELPRPRSRPLPGIQEQRWRAPQPEACILETLQNFLTPYWALPFADQILDHLGRGFPSDRMKLEYDFTRPKVFLWPEEASGIAIRRLSVALHVTGNEGKLAAEESFAPLLEAIKNIFASQVNSMIQDKVCTEVQKQVRAHGSRAGESPPLAEPDPTFQAHPNEQPEAILGHFTAREKKRLTDHFKSKALEREGNLIPERVRQSSWKFSHHPEGALLVGEGGGGWPPLTPRGPGTRELSLKRTAPGEAVAVSYVKNRTVDESRGSEKILTNLKNISLPPRRASLVPSAKERPLSRVLQKFSIREREKLLVHFSLRTLEMQTKSLPRIVRESHAMTSAQDRRRPLSACSHPAGSAPKRQKRIVLVFEEKSLHQIDLDLQYKYQRYLLGLPIQRLFPKAKALPKYIPKLNPAAGGEKADCRVEAGALCVGPGESGKHISPKKPSPSPHTAAIRSVLGPAPVCAFDPGHLGPLQKDTSVPPKVKVKSSVPPGRERKCHVWFQETEACKPLDSELLGRAPSTVGSRCSCSSGCSRETPRGPESCADLDERPCRDVPGRPECVLREASRGLSQETRCPPCGVQRGALRQSLPRTPLHHQAWASHRGRSSRKHASSGTPPSCGSCPSKRGGASAKTRSGHGAPRGLRGGALHTEGSGLSSPTSSSCCPASRSAAHRSLFPLTESNVKLHLAKSHGRLPTPAAGAEREQARADLRGRRASRDCQAGSARSRSPRCEEPRPGEEPAGSEEPAERGDRLPCPQKSAPSAPADEASPRPEDEQGPPFFYACVPADSLEVIPKTVRWAIPPRALRKRNFRLPLVAKVSSSCDLFGSSRNLLETLVESFSLVHQN